MSRRRPRPTNVPVPRRIDWGDIDENDLDAQSALRNFYGKTFEEAVALFNENALYYQEDLLSMPRPVFEFYAPAFVSYLTSPQAAGDSDGASSFLHMLIWMFKTHPGGTSLETETLLLETARNIAGRQDYFEADIDIYGRFPDWYREICELAAVVFSGSR